MIHIGTPFEIHFGNKRKRKYEQKKKKKKEEEEEITVSSSKTRKGHTCTISLTKLKPPGPITDPASRYPVITCKISKQEETIFRNNIIVMEVNQRLKQ
jgi:hypothetical protein